MTVLPNLTPFFWKHIEGGSEYWLNQSFTTISSARQTGQGIQGFSVMLVCPSLTVAILWKSSTLT
jgi:hypothetical protein